MSSGAEKNSIVLVVQLSKSKSAVCVLRSLGVNLMTTCKTETKLHRHFHQKYFDHLDFTINSIRGMSSVKQYSKIATTK